MKTCLSIVVISCFVAGVQTQPRIFADAKRDRPRVAFGGSSNAVDAPGSAEFAPAPSRGVRNTFDDGPEGWCSYDYHWSIVAKGRNIFIMTTWQSSGGVDNTGYVWCDETRWSADTPESPISVLPFITYANWMGRKPLDLRNAQVSLYLRGDALEFHGSKCYFWVVGPGGRWHFTSQPLTVGDGDWPEEPNVLRLVNDETRWHRSWSSDPEKPPALNDVLAKAVSYGISFVGFGQEPRGKFSMDEFEIRLAEE